LATDAARVSSARGVLGTSAAVVVIVLAAVLPYLGILRAPFVFDDVKLVKDNRLPRSGFRDPAALIETFNVASHRWDEEELRPNYRPLRFLSYVADYELSRAFLSPFPEDSPPVLFFHLTNVALHAANSLLVFCLARALGRWLFRGAENSEGAAFFFAGVGALLFAVHPLQTEAVTYVSGRRDVLSAFFFLSAVAWSARTRPNASPSIAAIAATPVLVVLGLLSKETVATLPPALVLLDLVRGAPWTRRRWVFHALNFAAAGPLVLVTLSNPRLIAEPVGGGVASTALTAARYLSRYLSLFLLPVQQSIDYSFDAIPPSGGLIRPWTTLPSVLLVLGLTAAAAGALWRCARRRCESAPRPHDAPGERAKIAPLAPVLAFGWFWFFGTLAPVLQFVPIPERFAERFAYLPALGVVLVAAWAATRLVRFEAVLGWGAAGALCALLAAATVHRNAQWKSPLLLWTSAVEAQPRAARAHLGRANALKEIGRLREAEVEYGNAISIFEEKPDLPLHHGFILQAVTLRGAIRGVLAADEPGRVDGAIEDYRRVIAATDTDGVVIESSPRHAVLHSDLAGLLARRGDADGAAREYRRVLEIVKDSPLRGASLYGLAQIALKNGEPAKASDLLREAYESLPEGDPSRPAVAVELADLAIEQRNLDLALDTVRRALTLTPPGKMRSTLRMREAKALDRRGDLSAAVDVLRDILAGDPAYVPALVTLGRIEAARNELDSAEARYRAVLAVDPGNTEAREGLQNVAVLRQLASSSKEPHESPESTPAVLEALEGKGLAAVERGELLAAREIYASLLARATAGKSRESQLRALRGIAFVEEKLGHWQKAAESLEKALELEPRDVRSLSQLGDLSLRRLDDPRRARTLYERYVEALPEGDVGEARVRLNLAELIGSTDPLRALAHLEKARAAGYDDPALDRALGYRYADAGRWQESLDAFNRYFERTPMVDAQGRTDVERQAAKEFVRATVAPQAKG